MKITKFNFKKDWHLVKPHLKNSAVVKELNKGMREFSKYFKWNDLPLWNPKNNIGTWEYSKSDGHIEFANQKAVKDPQTQILANKFWDFLEKHNIDWDVFDETEKNDKKLKNKIESYEKANYKIVQKYLPQKNTYKWYQCWTAAKYLAEWQKTLAEKILPDYQWKIFESYKWPKGDNYPKDVRYGCTTIIGKGPKKDYKIFDILLFENETKDAILKAVGLNPEKLKRKFN
jgi:hypothetical protein